MSTKLVVSIDGLLLSNFNTVVSNRSIDEVVLVGTSSQFNDISSANRDSVITKRGTNSSNFTLSVAFPNSTSTESIDDDFYNWLQENSISFFNDPSLTSLSSSLILLQAATPSFLLLQMVIFLTLIQHQYQAMKYILFPQVLVQLLA